MIPGLAISRFPFSRTQDSPTGHRIPCTASGCCFSPQTKMAGGAWPASSLGRAMSRLSVRTPPNIWDHSALGSPAEGACLGLNFAGAPSTAQLQIGWKVILIDVVERLGGTAPVYCCEETLDAMFQVYVSFRLPFNQDGTEFQDVAVTGMKCSTPFQAEVEASAAALKELQLGSMRMWVMDVSSVRCKDLENWCHVILTKASEACYAVKGLLASWEEDMHRAECCYSPYRCKVNEDSNTRSYNTHGDMRPDVADELAKLIRVNYLELTELRASIEESTIHIDSMTEHAKHFFDGPSVQQANGHRGNLPREIKIRMKLVLQEMMVSLGWAWPTFNVTRPQHNGYVCEVSIFPNHVHAWTVPNALIITGAEAASEDEAVENSCGSAISALERDKSICLVDLNYNRRSHGELYIVEAKDQMQSASLVCSKVFSQWESMVDEIHRCEQYCQTAATECTADRANPHGLNHKSTEAVAVLHKACQANLQGAKHQF